MLPGSSPQHALTRYDGTNTPIFVINLDRDHERLASIEAALSALGQDYERVRAIDGRARAGLIRRVVQRPMRSARSGRTLTNGEIGCLLSHLSALRRVIRRRLPLALILEDDAEWGAEFSKFLVADLSRFMKCCDILKIEAMRFPNQKQRGVVLMSGATSQLLMPINPGCGAAAYLVTAAGARRLASALGRMEEAIDITLTQFERFNLLLAETRPPLVWQGKYDTNLEPERWRIIVPPRGPLQLAVRTMRWVSRYARRAALILYAVLRRQFPSRLSAR